MIEDDFVAGTSRLVQSDNLSGTSTLIGSRNFVLSPQPSSSPNDPLNWPLARKIWHTFLICFLTILTAASSNDSGSADGIITKELGLSETSSYLATGVLYIGIACWAFLISPMVSLYGHRLPYLICISSGVLGKLWMFLQRNSQDNIWNQLFMGAFNAVAEANVQLSLSEIWFDHQRGSVLGVYVLTTSIGTFLGPLVGGFAVDYLGWRWLARLSFILISITLIVFYFGLEETQFDRHAFFARVESDNENNGTDQANNSSERSHHTKPSLTELSPYSCRTSTDDGNFTEKRKTYWQRIQLVTCAPNLKQTGAKQYLKRLYYNLRIFSFPAVYFSGAQWGAQDAWLSFYLKLQDEDWLKAPFNYTRSQSALMNIPTIIGVIIGCFWGGFLADYLVLCLARQRNGITEAEDRLWMMTPCLILSPAGLIIFGIGTAEGWKWFWSYIGLGMIGFGWGCVGDLSMTYLMDAYPEMVLEGMVGVSMINNALGCFFSSISWSWFERSGVRNCMIGVGCLSFFFFSLSIPMLIWGKKCRIWTQQKYREFVKIRNAI